MSLGLENLFNPLGMNFDATAPETFLSSAIDPRRAMAEADITSRYARNLLDLTQTCVQRLTNAQLETAKRNVRALAEMSPALLAGQTPSNLAEYAVDTAQRWALFIDTLRRRGNQFISHETDGCPPVLAFDYEVVVDGKTLERPVNYSLVRIRPPAGVKTQENTRPYIIIDPRAGHGSGIGGFKSESEVGVALHEGHPVYFVIFSTHPQPGQTLADVCRAEAAFVREVRHRHSNAPKPVIVGNCQGGWAAMLLAATHPDLTGPVVINGSPLSYWSGIRGKSPLRYLGGLLGGVLPVLLMSDLGNGEFDGANLVLNFEALNPANTWWHKYYDVFAKGEDETARYLEFERWWSGFYFMNEAEMRWIVENLFIGNKLVRGGANLDSRLHVDLRNVRAPVVVFASHGDNITPPPQALNWIADIYSSVQEIKARGQRIVYTIHDSIGHLGIFVSASVANKQHKEIASTLKTIEALAPGLYEMKIIDVTGEGLKRSYEIAFEERTIDDILALDGDRDDELPLAAVAKLSEATAAVYDMTARPLVQSLVTQASAQQLVDNHPLRARRYAFSDRNPLLVPIIPMAESARADRRPSSPDNPYLQMEKLAVDMIGDAWNFFRDWRDGMIESMIFGLYGSPLLRMLGAASISDRIADAPTEDLRSVPEVRLALEHIDQGGYAEAVIRMLILLASTRKAVRRDRLERSHQVLSSTEPFAKLGVQARNRIISRQSIIVEFEPELALSHLPLLLDTAEERRRAIETCEYVAGPDNEMDDDVRAMFASMRAVLDLPPKDAPKPAAPARRRSKAAEPTA